MERQRRKETPSGPVYASSLRWGIITQAYVHTNMFWRVSCAIGCGGTRPHTPLLSFLQNTHTETADSGAAFLACVCEGEGGGYVCVCMCGCVGVWMWMRVWVVLLFCAVALSNFFIYVAILGPSLPLPCLCWIIMVQWTRGRHVGILMALAFG